MNKTKLRIILVISVIIWMGVIYFFSDMPGKTSTKKSVKLIDSTITATVNNKVVNGEMSEKSIYRLAKKIDYPFRKCMHVCEYFVLAFLVLNTLYVFDFNKKKKYIFSFIICLLYACSDEYHQLLVQRTCKVSDVFIDMIGVIVAFVLYTIVFNKYNKKES